MQDFMIGNIAVCLLCVAIWIKILWSDYQDKKRFEKFDEDYKNKRKNKKCPECGLENLKWFYEDDTLCNECLEKKDKGKIGFGNVRNCGMSFYLNIFYHEYRRPYLFIPISEENINHPDIYLNFKKCFDGTDELEIREGICRWLTAVATDDKDLQQKVIQDMTQWRSQHDKNDITDQAKKYLEEINAPLN